MKIWVAPTGRVVRGTVLDVAVKPLERALKDYDHLLYIAWNPKKLEKHGCWEIRRRPALKKVVEVVPFQGNTYCRVEYKENNLENHVLDLAYLNYDCLTRLKAMDCWNENQQFFVDRMESREQSHVDQQQQRNRADMRYAARQFKTQIRAMKEKVLSGWNPAEIASHWGKSKP